jgi:hypothetical protein
MTVYVLTQREGKNVSVVGAATSEADARKWYGLAPGNDYSSLELDNLAHLGLANGEKKIDAQDFPPVPELTDDLETDLGSMAAYMTSLADRIEAGTAALLKQVA